MIADVLSDEIARIRDAQHALAVRLYHVELARRRASMPPPPVRSALSQAPSSGSPLGTKMRR